MRRIVVILALPSFLAACVPTPGPVPSANESTATIVPASATPSLTATEPFTATPQPTDTQAPTLTLTATPTATPTLTLTPTKQPTGTTRSTDLPSSTPKPTKQDASAFVQGCNVVGANFVVHGHINVNYDDSGQYYVRLIGPNGETQSFEAQPNGEGVFDVVLPLGLQYEGWGVNGAMCKAPKIEGGGESDASTGGAETPPPRPTPIIPS